MTTFFSYYDPRYGDTYEIYTNHDGSFHSCRRFIGQIGLEPIYYNKIEDLPPFHQNEIADLIAERQKKTNGS